MSDLLPEIQFHEHDRVGLSIALLLGVGIAALMGQLEGANHGREHTHDPPGMHQHSGDAQPHPDADDHDGHDH